jgi:hypothetical protein
MGARAATCTPAPGPGAAPGSIATRRASSGAARLRAGEPVAGPDVAADGEFEHVTDASPGEEQAPRLHPEDGSDDVTTIEERGRDREPHPERVDGACAFEQ